MIQLAANMVLPIMYKSKEIHAEKIILTFSGLGVSILSIRAFASGENQKGQVNSAAFICKWMEMHKSECNKYLIIRMVDKGMITQKQRNWK